MATWLNVGWRSCPTARKSNVCVCVCLKWPLTVKCECERLAVCTCLWPSGWHHVLHSLPNPLSDWRWCRPVVMWLLWLIVLLHWTFSTLHFLPLTLVLFKSPPAALTQHYNMCWNTTMASFKRRGGGKGGRAGGGGGRSQTIILFFRNLFTQHTVLVIMINANASGAAESAWMTGWSTC